MERIKNFLDFSNKEAILAILCGFFGGVVIGFLIAPIKKGIYCGNNNGDRSTGTLCDEFDDDEVIHF